MSLGLRTPVYFEIRYFWELHHFIRFSLFILWFTALGIGFSIDLGWSELMFRLVGVELLLLKGLKVLLSKLSVTSSKLTIFKFEPYIKHSHRFIRNSSYFLLTNDPYPLSSDADWILVIHTHTHTHTHTHIYIYIYMCVCVCVCVFTNPSAQAGYDIMSIFKQILFQSFPSPRPVAVGIKKDNNIKIDK